jgi:hypothetical protein
VTKNATHPPLAETLAAQAGGERSDLANITLAELELEMNAAAAELDFETARVLRDRINLMRGGATAEEAGAADTSGLVRQQPGRMGLGTSQQRLSPPPGWKAPSKPDLMTNRSSRGRNAKSRNKMTD